MVWLRRPDTRRDIAVTPLGLPGEPAGRRHPGDGDAVALHLAAAAGAVPVHRGHRRRRPGHPEDVTFSSTLSVAPALSALLTRSLWHTIAAAVTAIGVSVVLYEYSLHVAGDVEVAAIGAILAVTVVSCVSVGLVGRQSRMLANVRSVAETAQHVVLREVPPELAQVRTAVAYRAAAAEARIGGDLYEALSTRFGDRLLIGDVRGKGLPAVEAAADVLGVFREAAYTEPDLSRVADRMHAMLARRPAGTEEFVTAVLLSVDPERPDRGGGQLRPPPAAADARRPRRRPRPGRTRPAAGPVRPGLPARQRLRAGLGPLRPRRHAAAVHRRHHRGPRPTPAASSTWPASSPAGPPPARPS